MTSDELELSKGKSILAFDIDGGLGWGTDGSCIYHIYYIGIYEATLEPVVVYCVNGQMGRQLNISLVKDFIQKTELQSSCTMINPLPEMLDPYLHTKLTTNMYY